MKKIYIVMVAVLSACSFAQSQINEKDTVVTSVTTKESSIKLQADVLPDFINLQWRKGNDDAVSYYELYRSADGMAYHIIKQFHPQTFDANDNDFTYKDEDPLKGKNYYRLVAYNKFTQDKRTIELIAEYKNSPRKLFPSLISKGSQLYINNYNGEELNLWIYTSAGIPMVQQRVINSSTVNIPEKLTGGAYVYQLTDRKKMVVSSGKFILQ